jgi:hypothetical protein
MWLPSIIKNLSGEGHAISNATVGWINAIPYVIAAGVMLAGQRSIALGKDAGTWPARRCRRLVCFERVVKESVSRWPHSCSRSPASSRRSVRFGRWQQRF